MRTKLDQIEARLQALIESSVALLARSDAQHRLAHQLVEALHENIQTQDDGRVSAPGHFVIYLHPDSLHYWQVHQNLLKDIGQSLQEAARENGVYFTSEPVLQLSPNPQFGLDDIEVVTTQAEERSGDTAAFAPAALPSNPKIPYNAFLIVDGNQVYPLNQMVINIGRRQDNHLVLQDPRVSRAHAQIRAIRGQYIVFDLNSTGGTMVNGRRINQCALKPGDVISLSGVPLIYGEDPQPDEDTEQLGYTRSMDASKDPPEVIE
jgi:hypothetical protein